MVTTPNPSVSWSTKMNKKERYISIAIEVIAQLKGTMITSEIVGKMADIIEKRELQAIESSKVSGKYEELINQSTL